MVYTGFIAVIGSWKIIAILRPRSDRCSLLDIDRMFSPRNEMFPVILALFGSSPITAIDDTDLPDPDSPTMPSTSRSCRV